MCNPQQQMEPGNALEGFGYLLGILAKIVALVSIAGVICWTHWAAYQIGRKDYHNELLQELEAKGGAPILIYPPDALDNQ